MIPGFVVRLLMVMGLIIMAFAGAAPAEEEVTVKGILKEIDMNTSIVTIGSYFCQDTTVVIEEGPLLRKLKDNLIKKGDEVVCRYIVEGGRNRATYLSKEKG